MHDVAIAYLRFDSVTGNFLDSMMDLLAYDLSGPRRIGAPFKGHIASLSVVKGANQIGEQFLNSDMEYMLWLDADMGFPPNVLDLLLSGIDPDDGRDSVGALVFKYQLTEMDGMHGYLGKSRPVILDWSQDAEGKAGFLGRRTYPENKLLQCDATGMACVLIHRSVYEAIHEKYGKEWHTPLVNPSDPDAMFGPDVSFWWRAGTVGKHLYIHTGAHTNHQKSCWVSHASYQDELGDEAFGSKPQLVQIGSLADGVARQAGPEPDVRPSPVQNRKQRRAAAKAKPQHQMDTPGIGGVPLPPPDLDTAG